MQGDTTLNRQNRLLIVPAMIKTVLALILPNLVALPAFAQPSELGIACGGVSRRPLGPDKEPLSPDNKVPPISSGWNFGSSVKEIYYSIVVEPGTRFKIKAGQMDSKLTFVTTTPAIPSTP